ncbi:hypothetical protein AB0F92_15870 [Kitasatospora aureofaciens]|uniref:SCO3933 family regulatory protein n=1 Tax=Kitasatospora aureofaciens TaxID=1894 RepID=UPI0004C25536|nr:hypothetical protein CP971_21335 [Streptomyces viridifaciens]UKZ07855.1 hypothetical protein BOQ63_028255 [Streptomyces viridifaciens]
MQSIPVDGTRLGTMTCIVAPEVRIANRETGEVRKNQDGQTMYTVGIAVRQEGRRASIIEISVPGEPAGVVEGVQVRVTGLTAFSWAMGDRHGLSFRADAITPIPAPAASRKGGDA